MRFAELSDCIEAWVDSESEDRWRDEESEAMLREKPDAVDWSRGEEIRYADRGG